MYYLPYEINAVVLISINTVSIINTHRHTSSSVSEAPQSVTAIAAALSMDLKGSEFQLPARLINNSVVV